VVNTNGQSVDAIAISASHELAEAATDPRPVHAPAFADFDANDRGWELLGESTGASGSTGGEIADVCPFVTQAGSTSGLGVDAPPPNGSYGTISVPGIDHPVQRVWSNRAAAGRHDPCVPGGMRPYFNSAPVLSDRVVAVDSAGQSFTTRGVRLPVGHTRTIELDLFSDAPTEPWTVDLTDETTYPPGICSGCAVSCGPDPDACAELPPPPGVVEAGDPEACTPCVLPDPRVTYSFDRNRGKDGDTIRLTITQNSPVPGGTHVLAITSTIGNASNAWPLIAVE
jgi:hypothetical protein